LSSDAILVTDTFGTTFCMSIWPIQIGATPSTKTILNSITTKDR